MKSFCRRLRPCDVLVAMVASCCLSVIGQQALAGPATAKGKAVKKTVLEKELGDELVDAMRNSSGTAYGISIWENGKIRTVQFTPASRSHNTYSVAKLFTATMIGMLYDQHKIDLDEKVYPILQKHFPEKFDAKWKDVTVADVMRHRWGIGQGGFLDIDAKGISKYPTNDFLGYVLAQPLPKVIGKDNVYTDAAYYLLSRIYSERSGEKMDVAMRRDLLIPLGFDEYAFSTCPYGYPIGGTGMYISTEDMCKLGILYAQRGLWQGKRLLSEKFVDEVFKRGLSLTPRGNHGGYAKGGAFGQILYVNPTTRRVVAVNGFHLNLGKVMGVLLEKDVP